VQSACDYGSNADGEIGREFAIQDSWYFFIDDDCAWCGGWSLGSPLKETTDDDDDDDDDVLFGLNLAWQELR